MRDVIQSFRERNREISHYIFIWVIICVILAFPAALYDQWGQGRRASSTNLSKKAHEEWREAPGRNTLNLFDQKQFAKLHRNGATPEGCSFECGEL